MVANLDPLYVLLETDAPFLNPPTWGGTNIPTNIGLVADYVATVWGMPRMMVLMITHQNARHFLGLP